MKENSGSEIDERWEEGWGKGEGMKKMENDAVQSGKREKRVKRGRKEVAETGGKRNKDKETRGSTNKKRSFIQNIP